MIVDPLEAEISVESLPIYIQPNIEIYNSLGDVLDPNPYNHRGFFTNDTEKDVSFEAINKLSCTFIMGEPGYGKSVFIRELIKNVEDLKSIKIDCREFAGKQTTEKLDGFTHIYFDGLDEVPPVQFLESLHRIKEIIRVHAETNIFIACRSHYLQRFSKAVEQFGSSKFVKINAFEESHIRRYLNHHNLSQDVVDAIVYKSISNVNSGSVLKTPRYLAALVRSIQQNQISIEEVIKMGRTDIFEKVIYYKLTEDIRKQGDEANLNEIFITQRVLEKLAFIMEVYQRNRISKSELVTYLDEVKSNINLIFLHHSSIDLFVERTLKAMDFDYLEFEHSEFQEYLAAKELVRMSDSEQVLYDLILQKDLGVIYSSWLDVLQYAIELDADKIASSLANYLTANSNRQSDERLVEILMGPGIEKVKDALKAKLFDTLFNHYQDSGKFLYQKNDLLAKLYVSEQNEEILHIEKIASYNQDTVRQVINQSLIIRSLAENKSLTPQLCQSWKIELLRLLDVPEFRESYQVLLWSLELLDAKDELKGMATNMLTKTDGQLSQYLEAIGRICADEMTDFFIEVIKTKPFVTGKEDFFGDLKTEPGISAIFQLLVKEPDLVNQLFNHDARFIVYYQLFDEIKKINSADLNKLTEQAFYTITGDERYVSYEGNVKAFVDRAIEYLLAKCPDFLERFLQRPNTEDIIRTSAETIAPVMTEAQFDQFYVRLSKTQWEMQSLFRLAGQLKKLGYPESIELTAKLKEKYPDLFAIAVVVPEDEAARQEKETDYLYEEFEKKLMRGQPTHHLDLFRFFLTNRERLKDRISSDDVDEVKKTLSDIINNVNPDQYRVSLQRNGTSVNFNVSDGFWFRFGYYIDSALKLELHDILEKNRIKVIKYLPLMNEYMINEEGKLQRILEFLGAITEDEINELLLFCTNRNDDYILSAAPSFANLISSQKLKSFKPHLKFMIDSPITDHHDKEQALKAFGDLSETPDDKLYLENLFAAGDSLSEQANAILIIRFKDQSAIDWRFKELRAKEKAYPEHSFASGGARPYPEWEHELDRPAFCKCFDGMAEKTIRQKMEELLRFSLESRKKQDHNRYSNYLNQIVYQYFLQINSLENINSIRKILSEKSIQATAGSFKHHLRNLEFNFVNSFAIFKTISEPVKVYNELKEKQYLPIHDNKGLAAIMDLAINDLENFINSKGYYKPALQLSGVFQAKKTVLFNEDILQKTFQVTLENSLLRRGLRDSDIYREAELFDGKRLDLLLKYGFVGPIMAELKLLHNPEILNAVERTKYKEKMKQYIKACNSEYAYYIVFNVQGNKPIHKAAYDALEKEYSDIPGLKVYLIDCPLK